MTDSPETPTPTTLSQEHKEQTSALKKFAWVPTMVSAVLGIAIILFGWGQMYGGDMARMEAKLDLFLQQQAAANIRMAAHEAIDSLRYFGNEIAHKRFSSLFFMIGRRFNFNDKYFEVLQQ